MTDADPLADAVRLEDLETLARGRLHGPAFDYFAGGSGDEWTLAENRRAFGRWAIRPRVLRDVSAVDLRTEAAGRPMPFPVLLAPTALHRLAHPDGELATARAAASLGVTMCLSTVSSVSMEEVAATGAPRWFQLYVHRDRDLTADLVRRAHASGFAALVLTVDVPFLGRRERDERNRFRLPESVTMANLRDPRRPAPEGATDLSPYFAANVDPSVTWDDVAWLRSLTPMPTVLKGVLSPDDARLAVEAGVGAVVVSNHGGRQLDGALAALDALPDVVDAVAGRAEVLMDGGVRRGTDVLKAVALGARAVMIGRPALWGLAVAGERGVRWVLERLRDELGLAMALAGAPSVAALDRSMVAPAPAPAPA